jgi:site-specific recombinase
MTQSAKGGGEILALRELIEIYLESLKTRDLKG